MSTVAELDVLRRLAALEDRVGRLEGLPTIAPFRTVPAHVMPERRHTPLVACQRCGVGLGGVTGFACPHHDCPTGLGGAFSQTRID